jgi:hypothetical protein
LFLLGGWCLTVKRSSTFRRRKRSWRSRKNALLPVLLLVAQVRVLRPSQ